MDKRISNISNKSIGFMQGVGAFLLWGISPLYWTQLKNINPFIILFYRIFWSFVFLGVLMTITKSNKDFLNIRVFKKEPVKIILMGILIGINWFVYIYAINSGHSQEASLGYYINPLVNVIFGLFFFKEKLKTIEKAALFFALIGVIILSLKTGRFPFISFILALTFGFYGLLKKKSSISSLTGLSFELVLVFPLLVIFLAFFNNGFNLLQNQFINTSIIVHCLIAGSGPLTIAPLLLFAKGAKKINLSAMGFLQFISPTSILIISIFIFKENFPIEKFYGFLFVWIAVALYITSQILESINKSPVNKDPN